MEHGVPTQTAVEVHALVVLAHPVIMVVATVEVEGMIIRSQAEQVVRQAAAEVEVQQGRAVQAE